MGKRLKPSERAKQRAEKRYGAAASGVEMMSATQAMDHKENMRPHAGNAKLVRQGRMRKENGMAIDNPKARKANTYAQTPAFREGYDGIRWD